MLLWYMVSIYLHTRKISGSASHQGEKGVGGADTKQGVGSNGIEVSVRQGDGEYEAVGRADGSVVLERVGSGGIGGLKAQTTQHTSQKN